MLAFHVTTTRANEVCKSFSLSLSVYQLNCLRTSKGLSLGELIRLQHSIFPNTFALVLDSNLHDLNETNPDWRCFQQNCHDVVLCVENKSSRNDLKLHGTYFWKIIKILEEESTSGGPPPVHEGGRRAPCLVGPLLLHRPQLQLHIFVFGEKNNQGEGFIAFYDTGPPPSPKTSREGWSGVRSGLRRGESVAIVIINLPPSPISWCSPPWLSNSIVRLLDGDGLDEIYHVIELVLLGFDP